MRKFLIGVGILTSVAVLCVPLSTYATPQQEMNCEASDNEDFTPAYFKMTGKQAVNKPEAIEKFKKAELGYLCAGDNENAQKVRELLANVDKINFYQNRREMMMRLQNIVESHREKGNNDAADKVEARIEEIGKMNREDPDQSSTPQ